MENTLAPYHTLVVERGQQTNAVLVATVGMRGHWLRVFRQYISMRRVENTPDTAGVPPRPRLAHTSSRTLRTVRPGHAAQEQ